MSQQNSPAVHVSPDVEVSEATTHVVQFSWTPGASHVTAQFAVTERGFSGIFVKDKDSRFMSLMKVSTDCNKRFRTTDHQFHVICEYL